jgi:hypothetical protein
MLLFKDKINGLENVWTILLMLNCMWQVIKMWNLTYYSILQNDSQVHWQVNRVFGWKVPNTFQFTMYNNNIQSSSLSWWIIWLWNLDKHLIFQYLKHFKFDLGARDDNGACMFDGKNYLNNFN